MRILTVLSYYLPYTSGLTIHAARLAGALAARGHQVTVLASRHRRSLPRRERLAGVEVRRLPVRGRLGKVPLLPGLPLAVARLAGAAEVVHLHLPQADGAVAAAAARLRGRPVVATSHCDAVLPGALGVPATAAARLADHLTLGLCRHAVAYTEDYAVHSPVLRRWRDRVVVVPPPVAVADADEGDVGRLRAVANPAGRRPVIGMATRLAAEKGAGVLAAALPQVAARCPDALVLFAGQHREVPGEGAEARRLAVILEPLVAAGRWRFLGVLSPVEMAAFYRCLDVLAVPSLNRTESFGLVQVEAMLHGVPVVASDLPGVRQPVRTSGHGRVVPAGDPDALARGLLEVLSEPPAAGDLAARLRQRHDPATVAVAIEGLYRAVHTAAR